MQRLAQALMGPDSEQKLASLASTQSGAVWPSLLGAGLTLVGLVLLLYLKYLKARDQDLNEDQISSPEGLRGCAHVLYSQLKFALDVQKEDGTVRVTVHRVTEEDSELEQVIDYVGTARPSGKTRRFSIRSGVIGFAARTGETKLAERTEDSTDEDYVRELVDQWGYTRSEAEQVSLDRKTIIAVPIRGHSGETLEVVMVDCSRTRAFDENCLVLIGRAAVGFSAYIDERFK